MKKLLICLAIFGVFAVSCKLSVNNHEHSFSKKYNMDENAHWYTTTCEHTNIISNFDYHDFSEWISGERKCYICGYQDICKHNYSAWTSGKRKCVICELSETCEHDFTDFYSNNDATIYRDGTKSRNCRKCGFRETETVEGTKIHVHTYSNVWTVDSYYHWKTATCGHIENRYNYDRHMWYCTYKEKPSCNARIKVDKKCVVCNYIVNNDYITISDHTFIEGKYGWDENNHWLKCQTLSDCTEQKNKASHSWRQTGAVSPTSTKDGYKMYYCDVCENYKYETIPRNTIPNI